MSARNDHANDPYQDEIGVILQSGDGNARLLTIGGQNKRVERIVHCARVANGDTPIHGCERYLSRSDRRESGAEAYCR